VETVRLASFGASGGGVGGSWGGEEGPKMGLSGVEVELRRTRRGDVGESTIAIGSASSLAFADAKVSGDANI